MVSKAREDLPEPLSPVMTVKVLRGISTSMFLRLCWRAPCTVMRLSICRGESSYFSNWAWLVAGYWLLVAGGLRLSKNLSGAGGARGIVLCARVTLFFEIWRSGGENAGRGARKHSASEYAPEAGGESGETGKWNQLQRRELARRGDHQMRMVEPCALIDSAADRSPEVSGSLSIFGSMEASS